VDYRRVNAVSRKDVYPIPDIQDAFDSLRGTTHFATIDHLSGYWPIGMTPRAQECSAFCTRRGLYHFRRMSFGLSNAPATFCRLMHRVLRDHLWRICLCYLDDVIVYATSQQELLERLHTILPCLHSVGLKVKLSKCSLFKDRISFLGHMVSAQGIDPQEEKIKSIQDCPVPKCVLLSCVSASEMTYIVSSGALNSTHSLTSDLRPTIVNLLQTLPPSRNHFPH